MNCRVNRVYIYKVRVKLCADTDVSVCDPLSIVSPNPFPEKTPRILKQWPQILRYCFSSQLPDQISSLSSISMGVFPWHEEE